MDDRELLELAAKAAGIQIATWSNCQAGGFQSQPSGGGKFWNPLTDDGAALRLAIKLGICIAFYPECDAVQAYQEREDGSSFNAHTGGLGDVETRLVIVQAAAEIGRSLP